MEHTYQNGKIAGMMVAARVLQEWYENSKSKMDAHYVREAFAKECQKHGFDMFAYLRGDKPFPEETTPTNK